MKMSIRSRRAAAIAAFVALAILILNLSLWLLYRRASGALAGELARQLENDAGLLAQTLDPALVERVLSQYQRHSTQATSPESLLLLPASDSLRAWRGRIDDATDLAGTHVFVARGDSLLDLIAAVSLKAPQDPHDLSGAKAALTGLTAHSELYPSGGEFLMEGYAPLQNAPESPFAVVAVEADARFFGGLRRLRNMLVGIGALSVLLLVALGLFLARMEASLGRAEAAVQRAETLAAMGRMAAGIAHEIRNPLGIIQATAARLKKRYENPAQPDEKFDYIADEVERLNAIVTGYLNFAKEEEPRLEPLDLVPVIQRTLRLMAPELEGPGIALEIETPATCTVRGDAQRLQQVLMNLVLNSVQAMPQGGRLRVQLKNDNGGTQLSFSDSGPGIPPGLRERLFEPFFTTKAQGSGLGLTVARRIVEQHGGRITLARAERGGARVEISLPGV